MDDKAREKNHCVCFHCGAAAWKSLLGSGEVNVGKDERPGLGIKHFYDVIFRDLC